jgi:hypothetical protein
LSCEKWRLSDAWLVHRGVWNIKIKKFHHLEQKCASISKNIRTRSESMTFESRNTLFMLNSQHCILFA